MVLSTIFLPDPFSGIGSAAPFEVNVAPPNDPVASPPGEGPLERACEEYLEAFLRGEAEDLDAFCARRGDSGGELRLRLQGFLDVLGPDGGAAAASAAPAASGLPGDRLGEFRIIRRLGAGGMGHVFLAEQESLHRLVALKVGRPERASSPEARARLLREARAIAKLRHPNIVRIHALGEADGVRYLAMELVPGRGLDEVLRDAARQGGRLPTSSVLRWFAALASALARAHEEGVLHRDVKPSNILITPDGVPVLVDFGLARDASSEDLTLSVDFRGTPNYASPEQIAGGGAPLDGRTDVYSLGVTLYECLTGRMPFEGASAEQVFHQILTRDPVAPRRHNRGLSGELETVILAAMEKDRDRRYATAADFAKDLEALLELRPIQARPPGPVTRALKWSRRHRAASAAACTALLAGLAAALSWGWMDRQAARRFRQEVAGAEEAAARQDFDRALGQLERALAFRPDDGALLRRRDELLRERNRTRAAGEIDVAGRLLGQYRAVRESAAELRKRIEAERARFGWVTMTRAEREAYHENVDQLERLRLQMEEAFSAISDHLHLAGRFDPENPALRPTWAEAYVERWREALAAGDGAAQALFRRKIEGADPEGRWGDTLDVRGTIALTGAPDGAEVHLYRYESLSALRPGGERRLVPVPFLPGKGLAPAAGPGPGPGPGDVALAIEAVAPGSPAERAGLGRGDLVTRFGGRPLEEVLLVTRVEPESPAARAGLRPFDRLARLTGVEVRDEEELWRLYRTLASGTAHAACFARGDREVDVAWPRSAVDPLKDLGVALGGPEALLDAPVPEGGIVLTVFSGGAVREVPFAAGAPTGLRAGRTAYPLVRFPGGALGRLPLAPFEVPLGSYLVVVRAAGFEDLRVPVFVERERTKVEARADLLPEGTTPDGFVWIPPGPYLAGGDPDAPTSQERQVRKLDGYWISRRETRERDYLEFLNDPATQAEIAQAAAQGKTIRVPRSTLHVPMLKKDGDRWLPHMAADYSARGISWEDAKAWCDWRTARAGPGVVFDLPSEHEWEKAARGVDGRCFPWGDVFDWGFCHGDLSGPGRGRPHPLARSVRDASPWEVLELAGSLTEWCGGRGKYSATHPVRGGSWSQEMVHVFRAAFRDYYNAEIVSPVYGFRAVARPGKKR
jgi:formylglycine-generating enzyme required for sulfatase activity